MLETVRGSPPGLSWSHWISWRSWRSHDHLLISWFKTGFIGFFSSQSLAKRVDVTLLRCSLRGHATSCNSCVNKEQQWCQWCQWCQCQTLRPFALCPALLNHSNWFPKPHPQNRWRFSGSQVGFCKRVLSKSLGLFFFLLYLVLAVLGNLARSEKWKFTLGLEPISESSTGGRDATSLVFFNYLKRCAVPAAQCASLPSVSEVCQLSSLHV